MYFLQMVNKQGRLSREAWLEKSLEILASEGENKLTIDYMVKAMGVTKGSFYWHFKSRSDFISNMVNFWATEFTTNVGDRIRSIKDPRERLLILMEMLTQGDHGRYDVAMLNLGQHEPDARKIIEDVFDFRTNFVRAIFKELGFSGEELEMRTQTMVCFQVMECSPYTRLSHKERLRQVKLRHRMLTSK